MDIKSFLNSNDPLCDEAIDSLITHQEEDLYVDYKELFLPKDEKHWLGITADVMAFANTLGGYIVFGINDETFSLVGIEKDALKSLVDTNLVLQKLNRYVRPPFAHIRTKKITKNSLDLAIWYVLESKAQTHIVVKEGKVKYQSGVMKTILRPGMIFSRRSGTNQILEPEDFEFILNRRIDHFKDSILGKISKVVHAPSEHQVLVYDPDSVSEDGKTFAISDSPDALPVKGMSFTISPRSDIEELSGWIALLGRDSAFQPGSQRLWYLYSVRSKLKLRAPQVAELIRFNIIGEVPVFYWLKNLDSKIIKKILNTSLKIAPSKTIKANILHIGAFLGESFYKSLLKKVDVNKFSPRSRKYPKRGPRQYFSPQLIEPNNKPKRPEYDEEYLKGLESELSTIAMEISQGDRDIFKPLKAKAIDCFLYAKDYLYKKKTNQK